MRVADVFLYRPKAAMANGNCIILSLNAEVKVGMGPLNGTMQRQFEYALYGILFSVNAEQKGALKIFIV